MYCEAKCQDAYWQNHSCMYDDLQSIKRRGLLDVESFCLRAARKGSLYSGEAAPVSIRIQDDFASTSQTATGVRWAGDGMNANSPLYLHSCGRTCMNSSEGALDRLDTHAENAAATSRVRQAFGSIVFDSRSLHGWYIRYYVFGGFALQYRRA